MSDLEAQLRAMLGERVTDAPAALPLSREVRSRIAHRRQTRSGAAIALVVALVVGGALVLRAPGTADSTITAGTLGTAEPPSSPPPTVSCATGNAPPYLVDYIRREVQGFTPVGWQGAEPPAMATFSPNTADASAYTVRIDGVAFTDQRNGESTPNGPLFVEMRVTGGEPPATPYGFSGTWATAGAALVNPGSFSLAGACLPPGPKADPHPGPCTPIFTDTTNPGGNKVACDGSGAAGSSYVTSTPGTRAP